MAKDYHGLKPVTPSDMKMAFNHLSTTKKLTQSKITDHQQAVAATSNSQSKSYNRGHVVSHKKDLASIDRSLQTLNQMKGTSMADKFNTQKTGSYKGKPNTAGGGGRFAQMVDSGKSPALAAYIGRKKFGAKAMAHMATKGK